jgi:hypothetical protein
MYVPYGSNNQITTGTGGKFSGQPPFIFTPGMGTFNVYFNGTTITWKLITPTKNGNSQSNASANASSPKCTIPITFESVNLATINMVNADVNQNEGDKNLIPYPNPTKGLVQFNIPNSVITEKDVEVFGETGIRYFVTLHGNSANGKFSLDFSRLVNGIYLIRVKTNNGYKEYRIIKL